jgi:hypothetical protein
VLVGLAELVKSFRRYFGWRGGNAFDVEIVDYH